MAETRPVRPGEEIDVEHLSAFLSEQLGLPTGEIEVEQFPAGSSNLTYLVRLRENHLRQRVATAAVSGPPPDAGGSPSEYVLRRPPFGNTVKSAHDMQREFNVLSKLSTVYAPAPKPLLFCADESIIGSEFYLMERRNGLIIRGKLRENHLRKRVDSAGGKFSGTQDKSVPPAVAGGAFPSPGTQETRGRNASMNERALKPEPAPDDRDLNTSQDYRLKVAESFIQNLADLHKLELRDARLDDLGKPDGYNRRQVEGWTKRYFAAKTDEHPELEQSIAWLNDNIAPEFGASLIHNDYKFDNIMLDPEDLTHVTAVLDWEMVTIGDPLMDLGTTLGYWMDRDAPEWLLDMPFNPRALMENISRQELVEMYANALGRAVPDMLFYYVFGTFKIAAICQQIYARYVKGFTRDPRFAGFDKFVEALGRIASEALNH